MKRVSFEHIQRDVEEAISASDSVKAMTFAVGCVLRKHDMTAVEYWSRVLRRSAARSGRTKIVELPRSDRRFDQAA